tara:strand:- start:312 stop:527 length:216 start_codon:yes stop_codon:yes gene_type:complete
MNNSSQITKELQELKKVWRTQNFNYTKEQSDRYTELMELRRAFIAYWKENDMVWVGPSMAGKNRNEEEDSE